MMTKLEAVNQVLRAVGEDRVSSLDSGLDEAVEAELVLDRVTKEVLAKGWHCNTEIEQKITPDEFGKIQVSEDVLRIDTVSQDARINVTVRSLDGIPHLYNVSERTFDFERPLLVQVIWFYPFEALVPELQSYIAAKAAREHQEADLSSTSKDSFTMRKEREAYAALLDAESEASDANPLVDSASLRYITGRNNPLFGR